MCAHICYFHDYLHFAQQPLIQASLNTSQAHKAESSSQENVLTFKNVKLTESVSIKIHRADRHLFYDMESKSKWPGDILWGGAVVLCSGKNATLCNFRGFPTRLLENTGYTHPSVSFRAHTTPSVTRTHAWHRLKAKSRLTNISKLNLYLSNTWFIYGCHT